MEPSTQTETQPVANPMWMTILGWILTVLPVFALVASAGAKLIKPAEVVDGMEKAGWDMEIMPVLALVEAFCALLYFIPRTSVLGAILVTGYLGGATATHVRINDGQFGPPILFGVVIWLALWLRDARIRALAPVCTRPSKPASVVGVVFTLVGCILLVLIVIVGLFLGLAASRPEEYSITRSATIPAPPAVVFEHVNDFHKWDAWSPWKKLDPSAKNTFEGTPSGKGAIFKWSGNEKIGEGMMTLTDGQPNDRIKIDLEFFKPFPAKAKTEFTFKSQDEGKQTLVTWTMSGNNDLMGKALHLVLNMDKMLGSNFDEGLANLKAAVEGKK